MNHPSYRTVYCPSCGFHPLLAARSSWMCKYVFSPGEDHVNPFDVDSEADANDGNRDDGSDLPFYDEVNFPKDSPPPPEDVPSTLNRKVCNTVNASDIVDCSGCNKRRDSPPPSARRKSGWREKLGFSSDSNGAASEFPLEDVGGLWEYACPACKAEVPRAFFHEPVTSIMYVSPQNAGKTHHLIALERWMFGRMHLSLPRLAKMRVVSVMTRAMEKQLRKYKEQVFSNGLAMGKTNPAWLFSFAWRFTAVGGKGDSRILSFHDAAGENFTTRELAEERIPFVNHANAVIFIIDGKKLVDVFTRDGGEGDIDDHHLNALTILRELLVRQGRDLGTIPLALCINKIDLLQKNKGFQKVIQREFKPNHLDRFDAARAQRRSKMLIEGLKRKPLTSRIINFVEEHFPMHMVFPMATLGVNPREELDADGRIVKQHISNIDRAYSVEDPLLWLLWQWGMIPPYKE